jgi:D-glycero-beta-D-manno-heptose 1-phosphate adenylyltransferase
MKVLTSNKILPLNEAINKAKQWSNNAEKVVFTNGCFDLLHLGHIDYLEKAAQKGNKLVVGLNSDVSVTRLKGINRPIVPEIARARMLAALSFVDLVVIFDDDTPLQLIEKLSPHILIKGSDYLAENIVGAKFVLNNGGKVETIALVDGFSTTGLIDKIKKL